MSDMRLCTFYLADQLFGVDVGCVREVINTPDVTGVPLSPGSVAGLISIRGDIVTVLDLGFTLGLAAQRESAETTCVIVEVGMECSALQVDRIGDVIEVKADCCERTPASIAESFREFIEGIYKLENDLLLILNVGAVVGQEVGIS